MSIDTATARKVAKLARIRVQEDDLPKLAEQLSGILGFMEQLNEVDVTGIEPMVSVTPMRAKAFLRCPRWWNNDKPKPIDHRRRPRCAA